MGSTAVNRPPEGVTPVGTPSGGHRRAIGGICLQAEAVLIDVRSRATMESSEGCTESGVSVRRTRWQGAHYEMVAVPTGVVLCRSGEERRGIRLDRVDHYESRDAVLAFSEKARRSGGFRLSRWLVAAFDSLWRAGGDAGHVEFEDGEPVNIVMESIEQINQARTYAEVACCFHRATRALGALAAVYLDEMPDTDGLSGFVLIDGGVRGADWQLWEVDAELGLGLSRARASVGLASLDRLAPIPGWMIVAIHGATGYPVALATTALRMAADTDADGIDRGAARLAQAVGSAVRDWRRYQLSAARS